MMKQVLMPKLVILTMGIVLLNGGSAEATWDIYTDTTIDSGTYDTVNIYDSLDVPPVQTMVDMTGGQISYCNVYDTANFDLSGGDILLVATYDNSSADINIGISVGFELHNNSEVHLYGLGDSSSILIYDNAKLHIHGYNLDYDETPSPNWVTGQWENGQDFTIYLRNIYSYNPDQVILHEIPEPMTFLFLTFGGVLLRKPRKHLNPKN